MLHDTALIAATQLHSCPFMRSCRLAASPPGLHNRSVRRTTEWWGCATPTAPSSQLASTEAHDRSAACQYGEPDAFAACAGLQE